MAIELTYGQIRSEDFQSGLLTIKKNRWKSMKALYDSEKIFKLIKIELTESQELFIKVLKQFCECTESGDLKQPEGKPNSFIPIGGKEAEFNTALSEFIAIKIKIEATALPLEYLEDSGLSVGELEALGSIIDRSAFDAAKTPALTLVPDTLKEADAH